MPSFASRDSFVPPAAVPPLPAAEKPSLNRIRRPSAVLFACRQNAVRSPMAAALARRLYPKAIYATSAGVRRGETDAFAVAVMAEVGCDISRHQPSSFEDLADLSFDLIVTLAPEAHHHALDLARYYAVEVEYWPTPDPTATTGSREQILAAYREVRDGLEQRIIKRLGS